MITSIAFLPDEVIINWLLSFTDEDVDKLVGLSYPDFLRTKLRDLNSHKDLVDVSAFVNEKLCANQRSVVCKYVEQENSKIIKLFLNPSRGSH